MACLVVAGTGRDAAATPVSGFSRAAMAADVGRRVVVATRARDRGLVDQPTRFAQTSAAGVLKTQPDPRHRDLARATEQRASPHAVPRALERAEEAASAAVVSASWAVLFRSGAVSLAEPRGRPPGGLRIPVRTRVTHRTPPMPRGSIQKATDPPRVAGPQDPLPRARALPPTGARPWVQPRARRRQAEEQQPEVSPS
jgi:hypothetical protein